MDTINNTKSVELFLYEEGYSINSERFYREEIYNLEKKLSDEPKSVGSLCDWIANYHELALIYQQKGDVVQAQKCLLIPNKSMLYMAQNHNGDKEWEEIAFKALGLTLPPLLAFTEAHPPCKQCINELKSQLALIESHKKTHH